MEYTTKRQRHLTIRQELLTERSSFEPSWRECGDYILPHRPRFSLSDTNWGQRKNQNIYDGTATDAAQVLEAGMMAGITSPARPWFRITTPDPDLAEYGAVKEYLHVVTDRMRTMFSRSNFYDVLPTVYADLGVFGTAAFLVEDHPEKTLYFESFPIGSYCIAKDEWGRVTTFMREFRMTVRNLVSKFGMARGKPDLSLFSEHVKNAWQEKRFNTWIDVCHIIEPNEEYRASSRLARHKRFSSCYFELGTGSGTGTGSGYNVDDTQPYLRESGYDYFPVLCPRWKVTGQDVYATSWPGLDALGDIKQLQLGEKRSLQAIEKMVNPPMVGSGKLKQFGSSTNPGSITYVDNPVTDRYMPAYQINFDIQALELKQEACRRRINRFFRSDFFLPMLNAEDRQRTAREVEERSVEKLLVIGPVLEHMNVDVLDPAMDIGYDAMNRRRQLPPPPKELRGQPLRIEYISVMHQAQKSVGLAALDRFTIFVNRTAMETQNPALLDKVDGDQLVDEYGDACGISPRIIRTDEKTADIRRSRAEAQQAQAETEQIAQKAQAAKALSETDTSGQNGLTDLLRMANAGNPVPFQGVA